MTYLRRAWLKIGPGVFIIFITLPVQCFGQQLFSPHQIDSVLAIGSGLSGPGTPVIGDGKGGWRSGSAGVQYNGQHPKPEWSKMAPDKTSGSVIKAGLLPSIKPLMELHLRDAVICVGGDGNYYLTGSSGDNIWAWAEGVELWKSTDLKNWSYVGLVWSIEKEGHWEKKWQNLHGKPARALWAPELHYIKKNYFICLSMPPGGISILKSTTGRPEGPYVHATNITDKPFISGIDPTLFEDEDGSVYFTWSGAGRIARMKDDLSDFAEPFRNIVLLNPDHDSTRHSAKCMRRGSNDLGHEGAILFKVNGRYYLGAADEYEGRYSSCVAIADNIYGPYSGRHESVPCAGGGNFFRDKKGEWWATYFGNDNQSPWREKPGIVKINFTKEGKITVANDQHIAINRHPEKNKKQIKVLIVDGFSNHDWKETSRETKDILEETGMFKVDISSAPSVPGDPGWDDWNPSFKNYDVVIQNFNNLKNQDLKWPSRVEVMLEKYVRSGGGLYILHSANNSFSHWSEYDTMIGLGWRSKETGYALALDSVNSITRILPGEGRGTTHGKRFNATIKTLNTHPINKDFPGEWITPSMELYRYARGPAKNLTILSFAVDSATGEKWPVEWVVNYGMGRVYNSSMGHLWADEIYPISYRCIGFQTLMIRAAEWLATGNTSYPLPVNFPTGKEIRVREQTDYPKTQGF
jgi:type 1 glutamine amidotransferase